ncbi:putative RNA methylase family UPF0020-domain-containing protein [Sporodiniella umbellata]|nr:putative RNA methylase family UPF0020-domain-containing protein [Sporodiniella umbellata]
MESTHLHVLFYVPEGLEFIAAKDIQESLANSAIVQDSEFVWENKTGHVHLFCSAPGVLEFKAYIQSVQLLSVYSVMLIASEAVIPNEIFEKSEPTCHFISRVTREADWSKIVVLASTESVPTFRATFKKGLIKHKVPSQEIAGYIGEAFSMIYSDWKVKMTGFDYEVMSAWFLPSDSQKVSRLAKGKEGVVLLVGLNIPIQDQKHRNRVFFGPTSLNPCIAYCLAMIANPKPGEVVFDICCGTGTIPIEGASRYPETLWLGGEIKPKTLAEKARGNLLHTNLSNVDLLLSDSRKLCLRDGTVDSIVSDWPWGLRENSYQQIQGLYPKFMKQMWRLLKDDGKAYIVTQGQKLMSIVLRYDWCKKQWSADKVIPIGIGGYEVYLYILSKKKSDK